MKNSIPKGDPKGLAAVLDALSALDPQEQPLAQTIQGDCVRAEMAAGRNHLG
jgi:hypothetical protein